MKKLIFVFISSMLCFFFLCGAMLAESGFISNMSIGCSGTIGSSGTIGDSGNSNTGKPSDRIDNAIKNGEDIDLVLTGTFLTADELNRIKESERTVRLIGNGYIIELNPSDIPADTSGCDFDISVFAALETIITEEVVINSGSVVIRPVTKGDSRFSFKIFVNRSFFSEAGINDEGILYSVNDSMITEDNIRYNNYENELFSEFKMNTASFYIISEKKPVFSDDEIEIFDPAFGSDDEIETEDPFVNYSELVEEEVNTIDEYAVEEDSAPDSFISTLKRSFLTDENPPTDVAIPLNFTVISALIAASALSLKKYKD